MEALTPDEEIFRNTRIGILPQGFDIVANVAGGDTGQYRDKIGNC
jgi:hypothetical protein